MVFMQAISVKKQGMISPHSLACFAKDFNSADTMA